jgi:cytochrome b561
VIARIARDQTSAGCGGVKIYPNRNFDDAIGQYRNGLRRAPASAALGHGDLRGGRLAARQFIDDFPKGVARDSAFATHVALGEFVLVLLAVRLLWRFANRPLALLPTRFGGAGEIAATFGHYALYALLLAVPIVGIVAQLKRGNALPIFGVWHLASPWPADRAAAHSVMEVHELLANALLILAALHASAALIHHYVFRDRTLARMLPGRGVSP